MTIRVVLADDQEMVRMGFAMILGGTDGIDVVGQCSDGVEAVDAKAVAHETRVVIVTTFDHDEYVDTALANGASGFILKDSGPDLLIAAVRAAASGEALISPKLTVSLLERTRRAANRETAVPGIAELTDREREVTRLVAEGRTNTEIGEELFISLGTVKSHLASIQHRLEVRNRVEIAARAWQSGLMD